MTLATPAVIEALSFEKLLADTKARIVALWPAAAAVIELESEPLNILAQVFAYRELLYRARVNDAAAAQYIETATGADLDHKADFYGLTRMPGETDERLRTRLRAAIAAIAGNGTAPAYEARAMAAHIGVRAARALQPAPGTVNVVVWVAAGHDPIAVVAAVRAALTAETASILGVNLIVSTASAVPLTVRARITREASAPTDLLTRLHDRLAAAVAAYPVGRAMPRAWVSAQLYQAGVALVEFAGAGDPPELLAVRADEYVHLVATDLQEAA